MITPEGPAATRCERCARERGVEYFSGTAGVSCFGDTEDCYRIGCERLEARLVEVERREAEGVALFDKLLADANASGRVVREEADYFKAAYSRKLADEKRALEAAQAAESRASAAEGTLRDSQEALRLARPFVVIAPSGTSGRDFRENCARIIGMIDAAISGLPPLTPETAGERGEWIAERERLLVERDEQIKQRRANLTRAQRAEAHLVRVLDCLRSGRDFDDGRHPAWCGWADEMLALATPAALVPKEDK